MRVFVGICLCALAVTPVMADPAALALKFADDFAIPHFRTVAEAAKAQEDIWNAYCADRTQKPAMLREAYNKVGDAWAAIEFMRMGPAAVELRADRFSFWLDRHDATGQALDTLAAPGDAVTPERIANGPIFAQGLPMMERLLYGDDVLAKLAGPDGARRCEIGKAVMYVRLADAIVADWTAPDGARRNHRRKQAVEDILCRCEAWWLPSCRPRLSAASARCRRRKSRSCFTMWRMRRAASAEAARSGVRYTMSRSISRHCMRPPICSRATARQNSAKPSINFAAKQKEKLEAVAALKDNAPPELRMKKLRAAIDELGELNEAAEAILPAVTGLSLGFNNLDGD